MLKAMKQKAQAQGAVSVRCTRISENSQFKDVVSLNATQAIFATQFFLYGSFFQFSVLSESRMS